MLLNVANDSMSVEWSWNQTGWDPPTWSASSRLSLSASSGMMPGTTEVSPRWTRGHRGVLGPGDGGPRLAVHLGWHDDFRRRIRRWDPPVLVRRLHRRRPPIRRRGARRPGRRRPVAAGPQGSGHDDQRRRAVHERPRRHALGHRAQLGEDAASRQRRRLPRRQSVRGREHDPLAPRGVRSGAPAQDGLPALRERRSDVHGRHHPRPDQPDRDLSDVAGPVPQRRARPSPRPRRRRRTYRVRIRAKDATSGVAKVQFARSKRHPSALRRFERISRYKGARAPKYVRVRDRAGNYSRWRSIR